MASLALGACATKPLVPYAADTPPLVLAPAAQAGVQDKRARFREIYCAVLEAHGRALPDYRSCDEALARVGTEPAGVGKRVDLGTSKQRLVAAVVPVSGIPASSSGWIHRAPSRRTYANTATTRWS